jgi:hypothetical protein
MVSEENSIKSDHVEMNGVMHRASNKEGEPPIIDRS